MYFKMLKSDLKDKHGLGKTITSQLKGAVYLKDFSSSSEHISLLRAYTGTGSHLKELLMWLD